LLKRLLISKRNQVIPKTTFDGALLSLLLRLGFGNEVLIGLFRSSSLKYPRAVLSLLISSQYEYLATYVDDILIWSKDPMAIIKALDKIYMLKIVAIP
jgi:hypothetical protein